MITADNTALQQSHALKEYIFKHIAQQNGKISFAEYMHDALYAHGLGYYSGHSHKFGANGDFVTAPEIGNLFAKCLSIQIAQILKVFIDGVILEIGAGSGRLAVDLLTALDARNALPTKYLILEVSPDLRWKQQELISQTCPQYLHLIKWLEELPEQPINGVIFANEVIDAMPVHKFLYAEETLQEYYVKYSDDKFIPFLDVPSPDVANYFNTNILPYINAPYISEINLWVSPWLKSISACLKTGAILLCDYGFVRSQYYHPQRNTGTLMCHYQHHCHPDPFINIGLQDITAHVDFTQIAEAAVNNDLYIAGFTTQANFLLNCGITNFITPNDYKMTTEINTLTSPAEMGELFKVILLARMPEENFIGFNRFDKTYTL